nr:DUF3883 domain-containing protein [Heliobacterium chlorum]
MNPGQIKIENLGARPKDSYIDDVFVIWLSRNPLLGGVRIIGWYKNARVFRKFQAPIPGSPRFDSKYYFNIEAKVKDSYLLPFDGRTFQIPKATESSGGIGQSNVWYAQGEKNKYLRESAIKYIENYEKNNKKTRVNSNKKIDIPKKNQVEINAINVVRKYYEDMGYIVASVEKDNVGWDLEARRNNAFIKIEVKGLSGTEITINLTPNEFEAMQENSESYRLCIVTNALDIQNSEVSVFLFEEDENAWIDDKGRKLQIHKRISARITIDK